MSDEVLVERHGAVQVITINRPQARNALNGAVAVGIRDAVDELDATADLRAGVLTGAGGTFSAGMDLKAFLAGELPSFPGRGLCGITQTPPRKPLIGAAEGWALAGGFELVLACDLVVAGASARFGVPEVKRSLVAGAGGAMLLAAADPPGRRPGDAAHRRPDRRRPRRRGRAGQPVVDDGGSKYPRHPLQHLGPELPFALQLAQHPDARRGHPVDQHVGRRQVEPAGDVARPHVGDAGRLFAQPLAAELEAVHLGRLGQRRQEGVQRVQVHVDTGPQEPVRAQLGSTASMSASSSCMIRSSRPKNGGSPSGRWSTAPKSSTPSRPSSSSRKLPGCGSACSSPARAGPENRNRTSRMPARSRSSLLPSLMIFGTAACRPSTR
jgi:enoyl-CoA hydratase